jgi:hypothetical protein
MSEFRRSSDYWRLFHELSAGIVSKYPSAYYLIEENINTLIYEQILPIQNNIWVELNNLQIYGD